VSLQPLSFREKSIQAVLPTPVSTYWKRPGKRIIESPLTVSAKTTPLYVMPLGKVSLFYLNGVTTVKTY
jgi:hypothetical protein